MSDRATSPVLGIVLLLAVTAALAGTVASIAFGTTTPAESPRAAIDLRVDADANRLTFVHRGGDVLDARDLTLRVRIDGTALDAPPPVPFFSATGFRPGPTGPFNSATDPEWSAGETASFELAGTNSPTISPGSEVVVVISVGESVVAEVSGTG
ncbi:type IV pilin N-terminal domain-containing protein [Halorussus caseinilyticus]|uniref:Type IV pilin N-terminal domain-containing protein n=1 Tax=Halorussus caseinilyticus TaxID=3034025 RepID=A0ABD5WSR1_9EURY|nr:type IV pilin N-terminal domain-containing protein [Halorussus sp. DT72]